jgi:hypothetical protein
MSNYRITASQLREKWENTLHIEHEIGSFEGHLSSLVGDLILWIEEYEYERAIGCIVGDDDLNESNEKQEPKKGDK